MKNDTIFHIKTGGTISGCVPEYKEIEMVSSVFDDIVNYVKYIKNSFKLENNYVEYTVCHKDSRDVNDEDRDKIISEIRLFRNAASVPPDGATYEPPIL